MKWRVLISAPYLVPAVEEFRPRLEAAGVELIVAPVRERLSAAELLPLVQTVDGMICGDDQINETVLANAPRLKVISKWGTGVDSIDMTAAARRRIRVCNIPNAFTDAVADTTLGYMLNFARGLHEMDCDVRRGLWTKPELLSLREWALGIVGVGYIGKAVARRARAFGMTLLGNDRAPIDPLFIEQANLEVVPLTELLGQADVVTLHCDLNESSYHLIGRDELWQMKPSAFLINTARGPIIDETSLVEALEQERIKGAALDVFEVEPLPIDSPLRKLSNCWLAPHNANSSQEAKRRVHEIAIENLLAVLRNDQ
jgi:D-3-phosphoglycerate dehydrogenase / 2-oxoglutarate reductase